MRIAFTSWVCVGLAGCGRLFYETGEPVIDASVDAESVTPDASDFDAAMPDGATPDAAMPDAAMPDAHVVEASVDGGPASLSLEELAPGLATAICRALDSCLGPATSDLSVEDCASLFQAALSNDVWPRLREAEAAGTFVYDGRFAEACVAAISIAPCENLNSGYPTVCENALLGRVPVGGFCSDTFECVGDAFCNPDRPGLCPGGTCTARRVVGETCRRDDEFGDKQCERGLRCVRDVCSNPVGLGAFCDDPNACVAGAFCSGLGGLRHCADAAEVYGRGAGAACDVAALELCGSGLSCAGLLDPRCTAAVVSGAACTVSLPDQCPDGEFCDLGGGSRCALLPGDGAPCLPMAAPRRCEGGLQCGVGSVCRRPRSNGAACTIASECASAICGPGGCEAPPLCVP